MAKNQKLNVVKADKTALEAAQELIETNKKKDIEACVGELKAHAEIEAKILEKYGCVKNIQGQFLNDKIQVGFVIDKK